MSRHASLTGRPTAVLNSPQDAPPVESRGNREGASSGLGARFASVLAGAGANVVASARRVGRLEELAETEPLIHPLQADVTVEEDRQRLVAATLERFGRVDVLVNNAGMGSGGPEQQSTLDAFRAVLALNLEAVFALSQAVAEPMRPRDPGRSSTSAPCLVRRIRARTGRRLCRVEERGQRPNPRAREPVGVGWNPGQRDRSGLVPDRDDDRALRGRKDAAMGRRQLPLGTARVRSRSSMACSFSRHRCFLVLHRAGHRDRRGVHDPGERARYRWCSSWRVARGHAGLERPLAFVRVGEGQSNLTFRVDAAGSSLILRRPPLGRSLRRPMTSGANIGFSPGFLRRGCGSGPDRDLRRQ